MRLKQLKIENFRCYKNEVVVDLDDLVVLVGRNDAGKSSLFDALDVFFENKSAPDGDDVSVHSENNLVSITCVFENVPSPIIIDTQYSTDLGSEYLLNNEGDLEITKVYDCGLARPKIKAVYAQAVHPSEPQYNDLISLNNSNLKQRARTLGVELTEVNQSVNAELRRAIWSHADDLKPGYQAIELKGDGDKIWNQLKKSLPVFALFKSDRPSTDQDAEAQDPMKGAVKEAIRAQRIRLDEITQQVTSEVQEIANRTVEKIKEMNPALANQLTPRVAHKNWDTLFSVNLTGDEDIPINKRGSGTRRLVLLNFFRAKAEREAESSDIGLIYAIEEPETSQHPHNQILLVRAFQELVEREECQIFVSTHTPVLARRFNNESLRLVTSTGEGPLIRYGSDEDTISAIVKSLGVLPDHNIKVFWGVEGKNDIQFLRTISSMLHNANENVPDLSQEEDMGHLVFIPLGGSNIDLWVSRLEEFNRPEFYLMDRDFPPPQPPKYHQFATQIEGRVNCMQWTTKRKELENYIHPNVIRNKIPNYNGNGEPFEDVPMLFAQAVHELSESEQSWSEVMADAQKLGKKLSAAKRRLNNEIVADMTPSLLHQIDSENEINTWLQEIGSAINS